MSARLLVGVPESHADWPAWTGHERLWKALLRRLPNVVDVRLVSDPATARPDVWLVNGHPEWRGNGSGSDPEPCSLKRSAPLVVQLHEGALGVSEWHPVTKHLFERDFARPTAATVACADAVVTPSEFSRRETIDLYCVDPSRVHVAYHGVDHSVFRPGQPCPRRELARAGVPPGRPFVLCVSAIYPRKNLRALREAMTLLRLGGYPHEFVLVSSFTYGHPDDRETTAGVLAPDPELCPVRHLSRLSDGDLAGLMGEASVFCFPSLQEGFGLAPLEAMASGAPCVVCSDAGALPEVVADAALQTGPDAASLADSIATVLDDRALREELREAGLRRAARFSWERCVSRWRRVLAATAEAA